LAIDEQDWTAFDYRFAMAAIVSGLCSVSSTPADGVNSELIDG
jgi:hypothetical protein